MLELVTAYINENVLHSKVFDNATDSMKLKAVNQASNTLVKYMSDVYISVDEIPIDELSEQVLWILKVDDSIQRAEMGALMITVDGVSIQIKDMERIISPNILALYGKSSVKKRRVGSYDIPTTDTNRVGNIDYRDYRRG
jgi:hypothetical protein